jgi:glutamyl-tRNA reductase
LKEFLANYHQQELFKIEPYLYTYIGKEAVLHLFKVASGVDSQIFGENQIWEQVKFAFAQAKEISCTDNFLDNIFFYAVRTGKQVRHQTQISQGNTSIGSITASLIKEKIGCLRDKKILIIGVGKVTELVTKYLKEEEAHTVLVSNRTYDKAKELADCVGGKAIRFGELKEKLKEADVIISATASPHLILKKEDILNEKPLLIIDLAVPRDIDPEVRYIKGIELYCLDDMNYIIEKNLENRRKEAPQALEIINREVENLCSSGLLELEAVPALLP